MSFDLEDGQDPVTFSLKPADCNRFVAFMAECSRLKTQNLSFYSPELSLQPTTDPKIAYGSPGYGKSTELEVKKDVQPEDFGLSGDDAQKARYYGEYLLSLAKAQQEEQHFGQPVHEYFSLTYAQFLTLPRVIMEAMPIPWQEQMVKLLTELDATWDWLPAHGNMYYVRVGKPIPWPYEDNCGNSIEPVLEEVDGDLCNYRHPGIEHRRKHPTN